MQSRKAISRLYVNKAHMLSLNTALTEQLGKRGGGCGGRAGQDEGLAAKLNGSCVLCPSGCHCGPTAVLFTDDLTRRCNRFVLCDLAAAMLRVAGTLSKSTEVMKQVNTIIKAPELQKTMMEMSKGGCSKGQGQGRAGRGRVSTNQPYGIEDFDFNGRPAWCELKGGYEP